MINDESRFLTFVNESSIEIHDGTFTAGLPCIPTIFAESCAFNLNWYCLISHPQKPIDIMVVLLRSPIGQGYARTSEPLADILHENMLYRFPKSSSRADDTPIYLLPVRVSNDEIVVPYKKLSRHLFFSG